MSVTTDLATPVASSAIVARFSYVEWGPVIAGTVGAAAISFVLLTFGSAIGLTAASPWPDRGMSLTTVMIIAAIWTALVSLVALMICRAVFGLRVKEQEEREGLDIVSHGEQAYN